ncbi:hypothetical protein Scep_020418 [Stephania cephalantha]|uniref:HECT-type E3 ubiquitin transferase n=1 Tax=Stephania cephalantha TaxID=152367 RepID=A0AAP0NNZ2_9MAGN
MATLRSSLPSHLRQLLSGEGVVGPSLKLESEPVSFLIRFVLAAFRGSVLNHIENSGVHFFNSGSNLHLQKKDDLLLLKECVEHHNVPQEQRFSLLTRIRYARAFCSPRTCRLYSRICLLAFIVLVQSNDAHDELVSFFANEPEYTNELIRIVRSEEAVPGTIRTLAMLALGAQLAAYSSSHERARILSGSSIISAGETFYLLHVISSSSSGSAIRGSGMVPTLLPLLQDSNPNHMHLVCFAVKALQKLMDYSNAAVSLFKDLGGVELLSKRLQTEVSRVIGLAGTGDDLMSVADLSSLDDELIYAQKRLIKALLKALGSATYAPANSTRSQNSHDNALPGSLSLIFRNVEKFGGDIYFSAVTVMSEIIHKDPTCFAALHELGLPDAFLSSVVAGILPSSKAITCVPSGLGAICLNAKGLEAVKENMALRFLVDIFTTRKYVVAMNEGVVPLANAVEELLRHVSTLRATGVDVIIEIINKLASLGDDSCSVQAEKAESSNAMETDSEDRDDEKRGCLVDNINSSSDGISNERFIQLCIFHVMVLVHRTMENSESCRLFVEKKGIEALMKLLLWSSIAQSSEGMSIALHSTVVFKGFTQHHSAPLAHAFCSSLREHLKKALSGLSSASGSFLLAPRTVPDKGIFSPLFIIEFLLFLAASKDNRWVTALLAEFGNGSKDVLEDIGRVHREVLWQIALLEDSKLEIEDARSGSTSESQNSEENSSEAEDQRFNSFRQFLDPLLRRRMSGWSVESQFLDLISLYRDLGRATGVQRRLGVDASLNSRLGSSHQLHLTSSSETSGSGSKPESDKEGSYYSSCCDMMRSLPFHISHLFLELGKAMLLPSRRRDDSLNVSPSSKAVVSIFASIALEHLNFGGHMDPSRSEISISTKCRYLGKVVDFIDSILLDRSDSCNPILVNCFYGHGVIHAVLTTFEATSQLLFAINRAPASPMETDDGNSKQDEKEETDQSWIYGPLSSYGTLMDHLVTSSLVFSPFTKHLLAQPLTNGNIAFPRDAEMFVKVLQSLVLKAVLPIWTNHHFAECSHDFISTIISILRHIYSGVDVKNLESNTGPRITGPPPSESTISTIVEMGFSRSRAEEALRQVGTNSVEMAMEWLFSHPEEVQEDDELARALAMSLGNSGTSVAEDVASNSGNAEQEEEMVQLPPVDELLSTCVRLLNLKEPLAFPVRDLLVMMCSQNDGQNRSKVISFIIDHIKTSSCSSNSGSDASLSALFHVLALILHEDATAREVALKNDLVTIASNLLCQWDPSSYDRETQQVPKWVTAAFLAIDRLLQVDSKLTLEVVEQLKKDERTEHKSIVIDEEKANKQQSLGADPLGVDVNEQKRLIVIACSCIKSQLPSETMHVVLQLCATLTRTHSVAVHFLDAGGLPALLCLPTKSLFPGYDNVASMIVRHILEDPHTLQQAMESEIRHSLVAATNRNSNGRLSPRNFLLNLSYVVSRDPLVFMQAARSLCQIEMVGERPYVVLLKDREKEKCKEKEKEKAPEKEKHQIADGKTAVDGKLSDSNPKNAKILRKSPPTFISVIELLLDSIVTFVPSPKDDGVVDDAPGSSSLADMDIDDVVNKGKGKAIVTVSEQTETNSQESSAALAKTVFVLKLLTEILLTYSSSVHVLLRRDAEVGTARGLHTRSSFGNTWSGIFYHVLHKFLPYSGGQKKDKKADNDWRQKLASRASQFLVASCIRSSEGRRRVFAEINNVFDDFVDSSDGFRPPNSNIHAFVDLLNDILAARSPTGSYVSAEASATFIDVGLVRSLTRTLQILDLDHADSPKVVTGLVKALELVTKEHVHAADPSLGKVETSVRPSELSQPETAETISDRQSPRNTHQPDHNATIADRTEPFNSTQTSGSSESITDEMEHDRDLDESFAPGTEDDFMHEAPEDGGGLDNGVETAPGRTTSIYNLLGRTSDHGVPSQHPLLTEPSSALHSSQFRQSGATATLDRNQDNVSSRLNTIFRSLRNGRQGHRLNMWADDSHQRSGPNVPAVPQGLEELLVSQLKRPTPEKSPEENALSVEGKVKADGEQQEESERERMVDTPIENNGDNGSVPVSLVDSETMVGVNTSDVGPEAHEFVLGQDASSTRTQSVDMHDERNDAVRDVEAVSQESGGSGATLGESLRSLEVEIGSADGHDDGGERQCSTERIPPGDIQSARMRRPGMSTGNPIPSSGRDASLESVSEVTENPGQGADLSIPQQEPQSNRTVESGSIDPAFLDALPEELRAEVLSSQHGQVAQPSNAQTQSSGDIDPEFLAALPPDIRAEVLAQQQAQRLNQSHELEGQPVEMDTVSIIATFPSDLREEVLLTSSDAILANLTPALVAEANMLRERFAHRYHNRTLFGMYPRNRRGESSRRSEAVGSGLGRGASSIASRRSAGGKLIEADGAPLVDREALKGMIRLLRVVQPLYKGQLQRLLLNLCSHHETRTALVQILMDMLLLDTRKTSSSSTGGAEPSYRLYACQNYVMYSRPQFLDGVPPLVSRRILETLSYLARNHPNVARLLLQHELSQSPAKEIQGFDQDRGKTVMVVEDADMERRKGDFSIVLLLSLLNQPLYLRSIAHLEQLLNLLEVVIDNAESSSNLPPKSEESPVEQPSSTQGGSSDANANADAGGSSGDVKTHKIEGLAQSSTSGSDKESDMQAVLLSLPHAELRLLCSLLARDGNISANLCGKCALRNMVLNYASHPGYPKRLSDNAYVLVSEVLKKLVAIAPAHCILFITELADSVKNLTRSAMDELQIFGEADKALLSTTSNDGTAIFRVLQALSSLVASVHEKGKDLQVLPEKEQSDALSHVWEINSALEPLWQELSTCISKIESYSDSPDLSSASRSFASATAGVMPPLPAGTQNILPYIESFFVTCEKLHPGQPDSSVDFSIPSTSDLEEVTAAGQQKSTGCSARVDEKHVAFVRFSEKHRKLLNAFIRQNPGLLEKSFSLMLKVPRFIDFDNKRSHFRSKIKHQHDHHHSPLRISVRRAYILEDSYNQLRMRATQDLKGRLTVHFQGEEGIDAGGLTREWYQLLSRVIFDKGALLFTTVGNESTFQPNPNSVYQTEHLSYFKFVGRVVGKALFDGQLLDVHFTRSFYKHILGVKVTYHDIEAIDPDYFKNLKWLLENDISDILDLTFSIDADEEKLILYERTEVTDYELVPGGRNIRVTEENKHEYVDLVAEHRLTTAIRPQINAFLEGFNELIHRDLISIFNDKELELLISGLPDIDLDDLRANTEYSGYSAASPVIQWFWEVVQGLSKEDKARLLQFVTGTSKVPLEGFSALQGISGSQRFQIHKAYGSADHLPSAHTWDTAVHHISWPYNIVQCWGTVLLLLLLLLVAPVPTLHVSADGTIHTFVLFDLWDAENLCVPVARGRIHPTYLCRAHGCVVEGGVGRVFKEGRARPVERAIVGWCWREGGGDGDGFGQRDRPVVETEERQLTERRRCGARS